MRVSFDGGRLNERGVAVALFDYARHARERLGVEPIVLHDVSGGADEGQAARFGAEFALRGYRDDDELSAVVAAERVEVAYYLKSTRRRPPSTAARRTAVHEVFGFFDPHGDAYAYISPWLAESAAAGRCPSVAHIVDPPPPRGNLRAEFGVPAEAVVVGRHGGSDQFSVPFAPAALLAALEARRELWAMLLNTAPVLRHERVVHVPRTFDRQRVADFVASCDVGLNARRVGETFGLAICEYLAQDKPVFAWEGGRDRHHLALIDDPAFRYRTREDLTRALVGFAPRPGGGRWRERVAPFAPERVMQDFGRVFLEGGRSVKPRLPLGFRLRAKLNARLRNRREAAWIGA